MEGAGSEIVREEAIRVSVETEGIAGTDFRLLTSNLGGIGSVFQRPLSAEVRKHVVRIPSSLKEKPSWSSSLWVSERYDLELGEVGSEKSVSIFSEYSESETAALKRCW
jgi:hypothetical protein